MTSPDSMSWTPAGLCDTDPNYPLWRYRVSEDVSDQFWELDTRAR